MSEPAMQAEASRQSWLILLIGTYPVPSGKDSEGKAVPSEEVARRTFASREKKSKGPVNSIKLCAPERCWLVCSKDGSSRELAQYVQERSDYDCQICRRVFEHPSDLEDCRMTFKGILEEIREDVGLENVDAKRFRVNVTFGTKQMSIGAMFAAVDAEITQFDLTEGERNQQNNGTVESDTEELETFDPSVLLREHDIRQAGCFFAHGDFYAAQQVLEPYKDETTDPAYDLVSICNFWQNLDYGRAAAIETSNERLKDLKDHLIVCKKATEENRFSLAILRDILDWSDYAYKQGNFEKNVNLLHKATEYAAKYLLCKITEQQVDGNGAFRLDILDNTELKLKDGTKEEFWKRYNKNNKEPEEVTFTPPMGEILCIFQNSGNNEAKKFYKKYMKKLVKLKYIRNGNIHNLQPCGEEAAKKFRDSTFWSEVFKDQENQASWMIKYNLLTRMESIFSLEEEL